MEAKGVVRMTIRSPSPPSVAGGSRERRTVFERLSAWESRGLLTHDEAERIRAFELEGSRPAPRVPLVAEVVAYLGMALASAAGLVLVAQRWMDLTHAERLVGAAAVAVALFVAGWVLRGNAEPAVRRLVGVLWALSVGALAGSVAVLVFDLPRGSDPASWAVFALGISAGTYAGALRVVRPCVPLQVALYAAALTVLGGLGSWAIDAGWTWLDRRTGWFGLGVLAVSAAWVGLGYLDRMEPRNAAYLLGAAGAVISPVLMGGPGGFSLLVGVAVGVALLAASAALRNVGMLALGALGLFGYLVGSIVHFLSDSIGVPFALLLSGIALLLVAIVVMRLRRSTSIAP
jgi:hypothetical protein